MQHVRSSIKALAAVAFVAVGLLLPLSTASQASTPVAPYKIANVCYVGDPQVVVVGVGNWTFPQVRVICEAGSSGEGAFLYYKIGSTGTGWHMSLSWGAKLVLNTMGTEITMPAQYINHHIYCPKKAFLQKYDLTCTKGTWGYPAERTADGI